MAAPRSATATAAATAEGSTDGGQPPQPAELQELQSEAQPDLGKLAIQVNDVSAFPRGGSVWLCSANTADSRLAPPPVQAAAAPDGPLIWATKENQLDLLHTLLDAGANPDSPGSEGRTP